MIVKPPAKTAGMPMINQIFDFTGEFFGERRRFLRSFVFDIINNPSAAGSPLIISRGFPADECDSLVVMDEQLFTPELLYLEKENYRYPGIKAQRENYNVNDVEFENDRL
jgi:hypothetical protein